MTEREDTEMTTTTTATLKPGESTVADAATAYGVPVARVLRVLKDSLTDVYTPDGDGDLDGRGGVIAKAGRVNATVCTYVGDWTGQAAGLLLASDSIAALARYIGKNEG